MSNSQQEEGTLAYPENLEKALAIVQVAVTLGAELPAFKGSYCYQVSIVDATYRYSVGFYHNEESARKALVKEILQIWRSGLNGPWTEEMIRKVFNSPAEYDALGVEYRKTHDDDSLIEIYKAQGNGFEIVKTKIQ